MRVCSSHQIICADNFPVAGVSAAASGRNNTLCKDAVAPTASPVFKNILRFMLDYYLLSAPFHPEGELSIARRNR
jgi:hypothetical protein